MAEYGILPTGFGRKPLAVILAEIEASLITEFGPGVIQTSQSPLGQLNGLEADLIGQLWEFAEEVYASYDPDQAEGIRLETLAKMRLLRRASGEMDPAFRQAITNSGRARVDIQDIVRAVRGLSGVTYCHVFTNEATVVDANGLNPGEVAVAVLGGDDEEVAATLRDYIVPGVITYGNRIVSTSIDGYCRSIPLLRPILVPVTLAISVRTRTDVFGCPPPSTLAVRSGLLTELQSGDRRLLNGDDVTSYRLRSVIESRFQNVEFASFVGQRDNIAQGKDIPVSIGFVEMAVLSESSVTISVID